VPLDELVRDPPRPAAPVTRVVLGAAVIEVHQHNARSAKAISRPTKQIPLAFVVGNELDRNCLNESPFIPNFDGFNQHFAAFPNVIASSSNNPAPAGSRIKPSPERADLGRLAPVLQGVIRHDPRKFFAMGIDTTRASTLHAPRKPLPLFGPATPPLTERRFHGHLRANRMASRQVTCALIAIVSYLFGILSGFLPLEFRCCLSATTRHYEGGE
jgi:hypothetical protein